MKVVVEYRMLHVLGTTQMYVQRGLGITSNFADVAVESSFILSKLANIGSGRSSWRWVRCGRWIRCGPERGREIAFADEISRV